MPAGHLAALSLLRCSTVLSPPRCVASVQVWTWQRRLFIQMRAQPQPWPLLPMFFCCRRMPRCPNVRAVSHLCLKAASKATTDPSADCSTAQRWALLPTTVHAMCVASLHPNVQSPCQRRCSTCARAPRSRCASRTACKPLAPSGIALVDQLLSFVLFYYNECPCIRT